jgi:hypothetical protein
MRRRDVHAEVSTPRQWWRLMLEGLRDLCDAVRRDADFLPDRLKLGERESLLRRWLFVPRSGRGRRRFEDRGDLVVVIATLG